MSSVDEKHTRPVQHDSKDWTRIEIILDSGKKETWVKGESGTWWLEKRTLRRANEEVPQWAFKTAEEVVDVRRGVQGWSAYSDGGTLAENGSPATTRGGSANSTLSIVTPLGGGETQINPYTGDGPTLPTNLGSVVRASGVLWVLTSLGWFSGDAETAEEMFLPAEEIVALGFTIVLKA